MNLEWQEALYTEVFDDPQNRMSFVVSNKQLPCNDEFVFVVKAYGVNGNYNFSILEGLLIMECVQGVPKNVPFWHSIIYQISSFICLTTFRSTISVF